MGGAEAVNFIEHFGTESFSEVVLADIESRVNQEMRIGLLGFSNALMRRKTRSSKDLSKG